MSDDFVVRHASRDDVQMLARLINSAFLVERFFKAEDRTTPGELRQLLGDGTILIAENYCAVPVGSVYVQLRRERVHIGMLAVDPACQGRGIGRMLMHEAEEYGRVHGCIAADITVVNLRTELPPFYRALGYEENGTRPFPYADATRDCHLIVMSKPLVAPA